MQGTGQQRWRVAAARLLAGFGALGPVPALACALPPSIVMTLPTGRYMAGAALTVALTGLIAALATRLPRMRAVELGWRRELLPLTASSYLGFLLMLVLLGIGVLGPRDPMHNLLTLVFWTVVWVALPLASMVFGNLWQAINPWTGPVRLLRLLLGVRGSIGLSRLGHLPAILGLAGFSWFQIVSLAPEDPLILAQLAAGYWLVICVLAVAEGEDWLEQGEFLTVYFTLMARIAPFWAERDGKRLRIMAGWPGTQVLGMAPLSPSAIGFVTLALAALSFDGLRDTFWWLGLIGQNPLEFAGRSAVMRENTLGLSGAWALTAGTIFGALALGRRLAGAPLAAGPVMLSFLAIAAGYHGAHYLLTLLTTGQYTLAALNDPLFQGDALLGLPPFYVSMGFLTERSTMVLIWNAQFVAILGAHVLAVVLALQLSDDRSRGVAHLPLTVLMVGYTVLGLWLLASPTGT